MVTFAQYFHGVQLREDSDLSQLPVESQTSIVGLVGISKKGPVNELTRVDSPQKALELFGDNDAVLATIDALKRRKQSISERIDAIDSRTRAIDTETVLIDSKLADLATALNAEEDETKKTAINAEIAAQTKVKTDLAADKVTLAAEKSRIAEERDGKAGPSPIKSIDSKISDAEAEIKLSFMPEAFKAIYGEGQPIIIALNIYDATKTTLDDYKEAAKGSEGAGTGVYKFLDALDKFGVAPKLIVAPYFSTDTDMRSAMQSVAEKLGAVAFVDISDDNTVDQAIQEMRDITTSRLQPCYPEQNSTVSKVGLPMSLFAVGFVERIDRELGYWVSPSNKVMKTVLGPATKTVRFSMNDPNSDVNRLNEAGIATVIRMRGFRYFGSRNPGKTNKIDAANRFLNVRRTSDVLNETLVSIAFESIDQNVGKNFIAAVIEDMNKYLAEKKRQGAIVGGECTAPESDNPVSQLSSGTVVFRVDYTPSFPAEQIRIISTITDKYLQGLFAA